MSNNDKYYAPAFSVNINGSMVGGDVSSSIKQVSLTNELDKPSQISLSVDNHDLRWLDDISATFSEGNEIAVEIGYVNKERIELTGEISRVDYDFPASGAPTLSVTAFDLLHKLQRTQIVEGYRNTFDAAIITEVASKAGLTPIVQPTTTYNENVQTTARNMLDFLKERAKFHNYDIWVDGEFLYFQNRALSMGSILNLEWRKDLVSFNPSISTARQINEVEVRGWDEERKQTVVGNARLSTVTNLSPRGQRQISQGSGGSSKRVVSNPMVKTKAEADTLAEFILKKHKNEMITGSGSTVGMPNLKTGSYVYVNGVGTKFTGLYYVTKSTHSLGSNGYTTNFDMRKEI